MKKIFTLLAAAALSAAPALADTLIPGDKALNYSSAALGVPISFDYQETSTQYSVSQSIFPASLLTQIAPKTESNGSTIISKISSVKFLINCLEVYDPSGSIEIDCWIQNVESDEFPVDNNKAQWNPYADGIEGHGAVTAEELAEMGNIEVVVTFDTPFEYTGNGLQLTFSATADINEFGDWFDGTYTFNPNPDGGHICSGHAEGTSPITMEGNLTSPEYVLPVVEFTYTTETTEAEGTPVSFANVELKLESVGVTGNSTYSKANSVSLTFDVEDTTNAGEYTISAGNQPLGTINGTSGTIRYIPVSSNDIILKIEAEGETVATNYTVSAEDVNALFVTPTAEYTGEYALYSSYDFTTSTSSESDGKIQGGAQFKMTSSVPVTRMQIGTTSNSTTPANSQMMRPNSSYPENIAALIPESATADDYNYIHGTDGVFGVYAANLGTGKLQNDEMVWPKSVTISINTLNALYPVVTMDAPALVGGKEDLADNDEVAGTVDVITKAVSGTLRANMDVVEGDHFVFDAKYPTKLKIVEDKNSKTLQCFAPEGKFIWWIIETNSRAENAWTKADTNPYTINTGTLEQGKLTIVASESEPDLATVADDEKAIYTVEEDGTATSIQSIKANADGKVEIYNLQGQRLVAPVKGINIVNGKKIIF